MKRILLSLILLFPLSVHAQSSVASQSAQAEAFVKSFYNWYLQKGTNRNMDDVLKLKKEALSPELFKLLKADRDAQAKSPGEIVGLDFDPFLNAQDVAQKYEFGKAATKNGSEWIDIYGLWNGKKSKKPDLQAQVQCAARCVFVNFHYGSDIPENRDLIKLLKYLRKS